MDKRNRSSTGRTGFAHYFGRFLVLTQAQENRLTQLSVAGPFGELHLANKNRINPFASTHHRRRDALDPLSALLRGQVGKRTIITLLGS